MIWKKLTIEKLNCFTQIEAKESPFYLIQRRDQEKYLETAHKQLVYLTTLPEKIMMVACKSEGDLIY